MIAGIDRAARSILTVLCCALLASMVVFTVYTVVMRYVFLDPPFWGDTLTLFANIWLVMLALGLSIRDRSSISMQMLYAHLPAQIVFSLELVWTLFTIAFGGLLAWHGFETAMLVPGAFWELGNMPKKYPMMIMPISGVLVILAGVVVAFEDVINFQNLGSASSPD
jgi:TRAP-type C4-dicarboxylate transport system permease small subunit